MELLVAGSMIVAVMTGVGVVLDGILSRSGIGRKPDIRIYSEKSDIQIVHSSKYALRGLDESAADALEKGKQTSKDFRQQVDQEMQKHLK